MSDPAGPHEFVTTHWSLVSAIKPGKASQTRAREALEVLCRVYWYPLYAFVRSRGYSADDAQDLTQAFFTRIIETGGFASADRERGRFRSYLLGAMKHFLANEWHRGQTHKRGGQVRFIEFDALDPEARYARSMKPSDNPEHLFDRERAIVWLPLFIPMLFVALMFEKTEGISFLSALVWLLLWFGVAIYSVIHPNRGLHDRLAGTWVVRR